MPSDHTGSYIASLHVMMPVDLERMMKYDEGAGTVGFEFGK